MQRLQYIEDNKGLSRQKRVSSLSNDLSHSGNAAASSNSVMDVSQEVEQRGCASPKGPVTPHRLPARHAPRKLWQDEVVFGIVRRKITVKVDPDVAQAPQHIKEALHEGHNDEADQVIDVDEAGQGMDIDDAEVKQQAPLCSPIKRRKALCGPCASCGICVTPTWRSGPKGTEFSEQALCNACGTRAFRAANPAPKAQCARHRKPRSVAAAAQQPLAKAQHNHSAGTASAAYFTGVEGEDALAQAMHIDNNVQPNDDHRWRALLAAVTEATVTLGGVQLVQLLGSVTSMAVGHSAGQPLWQLAAAADCVAAEMGNVSDAQPLGEQQMQKKRCRDDSEEGHVKPVGTRPSHHARWQALLDAVSEAADSLEGQCVQLLSDGSSVAATKSAKQHLQQ